MRFQNTIDFKPLYKNATTSDIQFKINDRNETEQIVHAHKAILMCQSTVFERMFYGDLKEGPIITITDVSAEAFCEFLAFFYSAEFDLTADHIVEVIQLVDKYDVTKLRTFCEQYLEETLTQEDTYWYYELALSFNLSLSMVNKLEDLICEKPMLYLQHGVKGGSNALALKNLLESDRWKCDEIQIFEGALAWARASLANKNEIVSNENITVELGDCLNYIRFPIMKSAQFLNCIEQYSFVMPAEQYFDILQYLISNRKLTVANHFCTEHRGRRGKECIQFKRNDPSGELAINNRQTNIVLRVFRRNAPERTCTIHIKISQSQFELRGLNCDVIITEQRIADGSETNCIYRRNHNFLQCVSTGSDEETYNYQIIVNKPITFYKNAKYHLSIEMNIFVIKNFATAPVREISGIDILENSPSFVSELIFEDVSNAALNS